METLQTSSNQHCQIKELIPQRLAVSQKKQLEITFGLLRLNVGTEDTQDIIQDLSLALSLLPNEKILL